MGKAPNLIPPAKGKALAAQYVQGKIMQAYQKDPHRVRSMTIKVDNDRYQHINRARYDMEMSAQDIFIEALDMWLHAKHL